MPFSGPSDPDLPSNVSGLSLAKREQWVGAFNGRHDACIADGGTADTCEPSAFAVANAAIKERTVPDTDKVNFLQVEGEVIDGPAVTTVSAPEPTMTIDAKVRVEPEYWDFMGRRLPQDRANYNPTGGDQDRACSNCQWFINPGSCAVVDDYPDPIVPNGVSDLWLARLKREDFMEPMEVIVVGERDAEAKTYALIGDPLDSDTWQLPLAGNDGLLSVDKVALAIAAIHPGGSHANRLKLSGKERSQASVRLARAIQVLDAANDVKEELRTRLGQAKAKSGIVEVVVQGPAAIRDRVAEAIAGMRSQAADAPVGAAPNGLKAVEAGGQYDSSLTLWKDVDDATRFLMVMSNHWRDRDLEIIAAKAHRDFVDWLDTNAYKDTAGEPAMRAWLWHTPGTEWGTVDWAEYFNGFMVVSGTVDKGMEDVAQALAADDSIGVSHGFKYLTDASDRSIITSYRSFEVSALPARVASNPYTALSVIEEAMKAMTDENRIPDDKRGFIADKLGEGRVAALEGDTATAAAALTAAGVDSKEAGAPADPAPAVAPALDLDALAAASAKAIMESPTMTALTQAVAANTAAMAAVDGRLKAVEATDDEKVSAAFTSRVGTLADKRSSQSGGTEITKEEAKAAGVPQEDIFDMATDQLAETVGVSPRG